MDSGLISDSISNKRLKKFIKNNKIPINRYFDSKTRSIIRLPANASRTCKQIYEELREQVSEDTGMNSGDDIKNLIFGDESRSPKCINAST